MTTTLTHAPRLSLRGIKEFQGMEGYGLNATLYLDGKKAAFVLDEGNGGEMAVHYVSAAWRTQVEAYWATLTLPSTTWTLNDTVVEVPLTLETAINEAVDAQKEAKLLARLAKTKVVFTLPGDQPGLYHHVTHNGNIAGTQAYVMNKYPTATIVA